MKAIDYWHDYIDHIADCQLRNGGCATRHDCDEAKRLRDDYLKAEKRELITR